MITLRKKFSESFNFVFNKRVILRVDLNIPTFNNEFTDLTRLEKIIPTIKELLKYKAKILIISHFGRPNGKKEKSLSLKPVVPLIEKLLENEIYFLDDDIKKIKSNKISARFRSNNIVILENIRFYPEEENNENSFAKHLASLGEIFINDCFSGSHRDHSSIVGIPQFLPSFPGRLLESEVHHLKKLLTNPSPNNVAVLGGSKVSTKIHNIEYLLKKFKFVLIGGAMANTFIHASGKKVGGSLIEKSMVNAAKDLLKLSSGKLFLPTDVVINSDGNGEVKNLNEISEKDEILDIGPQTRMKFFEIINNCENILWNGPLGKFEQPPFDAGTRFVVNAIKNSKNKNFFSVAGGGDTISMLKKFNIFDNFSYVSTGGGAFLEFMKGNDLPGLVFLNK